MKNYIYLCFSTTSIYSFQNYIDLYFSTYFHKGVSVLDFRKSDTLHYSYSEESENDHDGPETESS